MGIKNLSAIINEYTPNAINIINTKNLSNKIIAIDASIFLYKYVSAIRNSGDDLKTSQGKSTSHIYGILIKSINMLKLNIIPIFVFDNKASNLKDKILNDRSLLKKKALSKLELTIDNDEKIKLLKQTVSISYEETLEAKEIADLLGIPTILAKEEADSQCAYLSINNMVDYVASEDMDLLTFGTKILIRNFLKKDMYLISTDKILEEGEISMDQFIDICILLGCDYSETIKGIGKKRAWELIKKYENIENLIEKDKNFVNKKYNLPINFKFKEARNYFKNLIYNKISKKFINLKNPQLTYLKKILIEKYEFDQNKIDKLLSFFDIDIDVFDD